MKHTPRHARRPGAAPRPVTARIDATGAGFPPPATRPVPADEATRLQFWPSNIGALTPLNYASLRARFRVMVAPVTGREVV